VTRPFAVAALVALFCLLLAPRPASAGERQLEVLLVNMTPDALSTGASKACVAAVKKTIAADDTHITTLGETPLRKAVGKPKKGTPFLDWPHTAFKKVRERGEAWIDAVVLIDCRPESGRLDVLVAPAAAGTARIELRTPTIDPRAARWVGAAILRRAWAGFVP